MPSSVLISVPHFMLLSAHDCKVGAREVNTDSGACRVLFKTALLRAHDNDGKQSAHVKASLMGSSVQVLVHDGQLRLGTWQAIYLCEFDGPRTRRVWVAVAQEKFIG